MYTNNSISEGATSHQSYLFLLYMIYSSAQISMLPRSYFFTVFFFYTPIKKILSEEHYRSYTTIIGHIYHFTTGLSIKYN